MSNIFHGLLKVWTEGYSEHSPNSGHELAIYVLKSVHFKKTVNCAILISFKSVFTEIKTKSAEEMRIAQLSSLKMNGLYEYSKIMLAQLHIKCILHAFFCV